MRFNPAQLRMLQESLAPSLPNLAPPPEMVAPHAPAQPFLGHLHSAAENPKQTAIIGWAVPCAYFCSITAAGYLGVYWSIHFLVLSVSPLPLALAAHALLVPHSRVAQALGLACAVLLPAACASPWPDLALLGVAALGSAFFSAAAQGSGLVRSFSAALTILLAFLACCAAITEAQSVRYTISLFVAMSIYGQSVMSGAGVGRFALICAVKS